MFLQSTSKVVDRGKASTVLLQPCYQSSHVSLESPLNCQLKEKLYLKLQLNNISSLVNSLISQITKEPYDAKIS